MKKQLADLETFQFVPVVFCYCNLALTGGTCSSLTLVSTLERASIDAGSAWWVLCCHYRLDEPATQSPILWLGATVLNEGIGV
jgi:hypothetical protein